MKRNIISIFNFQFSIALCAVLLAGCRQESDNVLNYAYNDNMVFAKAKGSYAAKFDVLWKGLNTNYALWDYENEQGLDWDAVYDEYMPKFAALDSAQSAVTDAELKALLDSVVAPLHDGHLTVMMLNHQTGTNIATAPGRLRVQRERGEEYQEVKDKPIKIDYYTTNGELVEFKTANTNTFETIAQPAISAIRQKVNELQTKLKDGTITPEERDTLTIYRQIFAEMKETIKGSVTDAIEAYNLIVIRYAYLNIPGLVEVDAKLNEYGLTIAYGLFKGNIAYLGFDHFKLSIYLNDAYTRQMFGTPSASTQAVIDSVRATWRAWFEAIQAHHKAGDLGGVIIDIRSNGGGLINDYRYVLGALLPAGDMHDCNARFKRGPGRYDYSPILPQYLSTLTEEHVEVTEPIVVLCNCASVSMAEHIAYGAKVLDNAKLIGTRTWGGFSILSGTESYTDNYAGHVGIQGVTPVYCYTPMEVALTRDDEVVEGHGIEPDIEVGLNLYLYHGALGPDNQLDRALQFVRTGN